jgi:molybdate transport system substrate-binding protein
MNFAGIYEILIQNAKDGLMLRHRSRIHRFACLLLISLLIMPAMLKADSKPKQVILVAAAASLKDVLTELGKAFEKQFPALEVTFQFAASGALQQQIEQGAPVDVFVSASEKQTTALLQKDLVVKESLRVLFSNELVLVVPRDQPAPRSLADLKKPAYKRLALGESRTVPAGQYAEAWLKKAGLLEALRNRFVPASNVRQVLTFVETGNVAAGFVYATDALTSQKATIALRADADQHPPIIYPMARIKRSQKQAAAQSFTAFLESPDARTIILKHGFRLPPGKAS